MSSTDILYIIVSYLIGAISPGILLGKRLKGIDIREYGSGNTGTTNVLRTLGPAAAAAAFLVDTLKGALAVWIGRHSALDILPYICGGAAIIGHIWPVYVGFKGGRGVATAAGIVITLFPLGGVILLGIWVLIIALTRYVSLGSILASALSIPIFVLMKAGQYRVWFAVFLAAIIIYKHRSNIGRLLKGTESKIGQRVKVNKDK